MNQLGHITVEEFLRDYWQKKPLLIRNALPDFESPTDPDEIAGLALEEDVESRIIIEDGDDHKWQLLNGPFEEDIFQKLPPEKWTLLVQGVDHWVPEMADIASLFNFIPSWRRDDLMVSFAPKGGSVGPHYDNYDVFLIQAMGQRKWQVGPKCSNESKTVEETPLRILAEMDVTDEWTLNPGDILYLPPLYAHNGVAQNDCMTFSVGFRAPSEADTLRSYTDYVGIDLDEELRYTDPDQEDASKAPALVDEAAVDRIQAILLKAANDREQIQAWLASYMTDPKYPEIHEPLEEPLDWDELSPIFEEATHLINNEMSRLAYVNDEDGTLLFANGEPVDCFTGEAAELVKLIANKRYVELSEIATLCKNGEAREALLNLVNENLVYFDELE